MKIICLLVFKDLCDASILNMMNVSSVRCLSVGKMLMYLC